VAAMKKAGMNEQDLLSAVSTANRRGSGSNGVVFDIPGLDDFVFKKLRGKDGSTAIDTIHARSLKPVVDNLPGENIGQPVAMFDDDEYVVVKQAGPPSGAPPHEERETMSKREADQLYLQHIDRIANMPQQSYDDLAALFVNLRKHGLVFDPSLTN